MNNKNGIHLKDDKHISRVNFEGLSDIHAVEINKKQSSRRKDV
jgi:hypothetical protein